MIYIIRGALFDKIIYHTEDSHEITYSAYTVGTRTFISVFVFLDHSVVWGYLPSERQNRNSQKLTIKKLSRADSEGLQSLFGQAHLNGEQ